MNAEVGARAPICWNGINIKLVRLPDRVKVLDDIQLDKSSKFHGHIARPDDSA